MPDDVYEFGLAVHRNPEPACRRVGESAACPHSLGPFRTARSVTYTGGLTVHGLTRHSAWVEKGDSGGANVSVFGGYHAEGVTSGASLITDISGKKRCLSKFGLPNVSWYFPIADSLAYYGPKYGVTTW